DGLGGDHAHRLGGVGEHELGRHVADGEDVRHVRTTAAVHRDRATLGERDTGVLQAVALHVGDEAHSLQHLVGLEDLLLALPGHGDADLLTRLVDGLHLRGREYVDAESAIAPGQFGRHLLVLGGHHAVHEFDDGDLDAVVVEDVGELDPDGPRAADDDALRQLGGQDLLLVGDNPVTDGRPR